MGVNGSFLIHVVWDSQILKTETKITVSVLLWQFIYLGKDNSFEIHRCLVFSSTTDF